MRIRSVSAFTVILILLSTVYLYSKPDTPTIISPEDSLGETFNSNPWIYFSVNDVGGYNINDVRIQVNGATTLDYYANAYPTEFYPLPATNGQTIGHRIHSLSQGTNDIQVTIYNDNITDRVSTAASFSINVAAAPTWTDDPIVAGTTLIKADHFNELKTAIDSLRDFRGSGAGTYVDLPVASGDLIKIAAINELRTAITSPYNEATGSDPTFTTPDPMTQDSLIRDDHINELRDDVLLP